MGMPMRAMTNTSVAHRGFELYVPASIPSLLEIELHQEKVITAKLDCQHCMRVHENKRLSRQKS